MSSTILLNDTVSFVQTHVRMAPLIGAGGVVNEPALSICNDTLQLLLSSPYDWKFNKAAILPFTTIPYQQDYLLSGCQMSISTNNSPPSPVCIVHLNAVNSVNGAGLTESGTTVTASFTDFAPNGTFGLNGPPGSAPVTSGTSIPQVGNLVTIVGASQSPYNVTNAVITALVTSPSGAINGVKFTIATSGLSPDGGQGIGDLNWVSHCTLQDYMNTSTVKPVHDIEVVASLYPESIIQPPFKVCMQLENSPTVVSIILTDPNANNWQLGVNSFGQVIISSTNLAGIPSYPINDSSGATWLLTVNAQGQLVTTATSTSVNPTILYVSPNYGIQITTAGILMTLGAGTGSTFGTTLLFRFWPIPSSQIWNAFIFYQQKAPIKTSLASTWAPWPDNLGYVLRSGVLSAALQWYEDPRAPMAEAKHQQNVLKALDIKDQEARAESYFPDLPLLRGG
jgi:hypothetical protein